MSIGALHDPQTRSVPEPVRERGWLVRVVVPLTVMYNGILAIINAHVDLRYTVSGGRGTTASEIIVTDSER